MKPRIIVTIIIGVTLMLLIQSSAPALNPAASAPLSTIETSRQFHQGQFHGPGGELMDLSVAGFASTTWEFLFTRNNRTPDVPLPRNPVDPTHFNKSGRNQLNATWLGHSSLMVNIDGYKLLVDPVFQKRVSLVGPSRFNGKVPFDIQQLPPVDAVIISHDHYDHLNKHTVQQIQSRANLFIVPLKVGERLAQWGVPRQKIVELDWWAEFRLDADLKITATPAQHFSGRGLTDRNKTLWASWVITGPTHNIFYSGDSGYFPGFKQIGRKYGPFDMTFLECGAYNEAWHPVHMFPEETVRAHLDLKGALLHPIHWATFNLSLHPWYEPMERLANAAEKAGIDIATPVVGGTTVFGEPLVTKRWWQPFMPRAAS